MGSSGLSFRLQIPSDLAHQVVESTRQERETGATTYLKAIDAIADVCQNHAPAIDLSRFKVSEFDGARLGGEWNTAKLAAKDDLATGSKDNG